MRTQDCEACGRKGVELFDGRFRQHRKRKDGPWCPEGGNEPPRMVTGHAYDCGPVNTGAPCIAWVPGEPMGVGTLVATPTKVCGKREHEHRYSEYVDTAPGAMHEPEEYEGDLDWHDTVPQ